MHFLVFLVQGVLELLDLLFVGLGDLGLGCQFGDFEFQCGVFFAKRLELLIEQY